MTAEELLAKRKKEILDRCLDLVLDTYPHDSVELFREQRDPFANPVGSTFRRELEILLDGIIASVESKELIPSLDAIIRIRAVQEFRPSEALAFILHLKKVIREELQSAQMGPGLLKDLARLDLRMDELAFAAFDLYTACRERIAEIRVGEARAERDRLANLLTVKIRRVK